MPRWSGDQRTDRVAMNIIAVLRIAQNVTQENGMDLEDAIVTVVGQFRHAEIFDEILYKNLIQEMPSYAEKMD